MISNRYGKYSVEGLKNVSLDNKGINLTGQRGAKARSIFEGEVTALFNLGGMYNIIVSHGKYLTVYCNLSKVSVKQGQKVTTNQILGTIATDDSGNATLQFQVRKGKTTLNPEQWISR
jgi:murein DD-endopeptidase MepM/ murein hydrolase activator NlpD